MVVDSLVNAKEESLKRIQKIVNQDIPFEKVDIRDAAGLEKVFQKYPVSFFFVVCSTRIALNIFKYMQ